MKRSDGKMGINIICRLGITIRKGEKTMTVLKMTGLKIKTCGRTNTITTGTDGNANVTRTDWRTKAYNKDGLKKDGLEDRHK